MNARRILADAVNLLHAAALEALVAGDGEAGARCMRAAESLELTGIEVEFSYTDDPAAAVRRALFLLSTLPDEVFASEPVLDAAADAQAALRRLG